MLSRNGFIVGMNFLMAVMMTNTATYAQSASETDLEVCQLGEGFSEVFSISDIKISFEEEENGYMVYFASDNPARKEAIRKMIFELLKEKSLRTHQVTDGYELESR